MTDANVATYFIGNGFDLNIGLDTKYSSFLDWYTNQSEFYFLYQDANVRKNEHFRKEDYINVINKFRTQVLKKDKERWADLELALGRATTDNLFKPKYIDNTKWNTGEEIFLACKYDLDLNLRCYLLNQNKRVEGVDFGGDARRIMQKMIAMGGRDAYRKVNVVSFNYTDVVKTMVENSTSRDPDPVSGKLYFEGVEVEYIQIHGDLNHSFALGVDNIGQIKSDYHKENDLSRSVLLKSEMIKPDAIKRLEYMIKQTYDFYIYGMSIGETDKRWWREIGEELSSRKGEWIKELVIYSYHQGYDTEPTYAQRHYLESEKELFCEMAGISSGSLYDQDQIRVEINTDLFTFQKLRGSELKKAEKVEVPEKLRDKVTIIPKQKP